MTKEFYRRSKNGKAYIHAGFGVQDAVGAEKPSDAIPIQEGLRLIFAKGVDRIWLFICISALLHRFKKSRKKRKK